MYQQIKWRVKWELHEHVKNAVNLMGLLLLMRNAATIFGIFASHAYGRTRNKRRCNHEDISQERQHPKTAPENFDHLPGMRQKGNVTTIRVPEDRTGKTDGMLFAEVRKNKCKTETGGGSVMKFDIGNVQNIGLINLGLVEELEPKGKPT